MTPDDRKLFESLCVAMAGGVLADQGLNPAMVRWSGIAYAAREALSAIRAAEGEEATPAPERNCSNCKHRDLETYVSPCIKCKHAHYGTYASKWEPRDTQSVRTIGGGAGTASDLTADATIWALTEKLDKALAERDQAEAIIHALCDERASRRSARRVDAERARLLADDLRGRKPARKVLPAGHVPERLEVGMVVTWRELHGESRVVTRIEDGIAYGGASPEGQNWGVAYVDKDRRLGEITLAAPFEVPND